MESRLGVRHDRLDLYDEDDPGQSMKGEDVDRATLAPHREGNLNRHLPAGCTKQEHERVHEPGVRLVEQPVESFAIPPKADINGRTNRRGDRSERRDRHGLDFTRFDLRDERARCPGEPANVLLSQAPAHSNRPEATPEPKIHVASLTRLDYLPLTIRR